MLCDRWQRLGDITVPVVYNMHFAVLLSTSLCWSCLCWSALLFLSSRFPLRVPSFTLSAAWHSWCAVACSAVVIFSGTFGYFWVLQYLRCWQCLWQASKLQACAVAASLLLSCQRMHARPLARSTYVDEVLVIVCICGLLCRHLPEQAYPR
jgi:magnesium-transporting ATPase (P-type)